mgnify:CR=1 FL=1
MDDARSSINFAFWSRMVYHQKAYRKALNKLDITQSMSHKDNCHDNPPIKNFFIMKREYLNHVHPNNIDELVKVVAKHTH